VGVIERRERERVEVRRKILDAARELFMTEGYEKVTMRRIADAIEYSATTIYNHFEDKDDLVQALCTEDFERLFEHLRDRLKPADPLEAIRQLGIAYAQFGTSFPNHYRFMFLTPAKFEHPEERDFSPGERAFGLLRAAVEAAIASGHFRPGDVDTMAQVLWASMHGIVALLITLPPSVWPHGPARPDIVEQVVDASIRAFASPGPRPASGAAKG
jgi:AcrR family transcriptional regulator